MTMVNPGLKGLTADQNDNRFNLFYLPIKSLLLGMKGVLQHQDLKMFRHKSNKYE